MKPSHGGARPGAGRPPRGIVRVAPRAGLDAAESAALDALMAKHRCDAVTAIRLALILAKPKEQT
jgi:hypothetical protein